MSKGNCQYVYLWADGIHSNIRFDDNEGRSSDEKRQCLLVLMGATADGTKELMGAVADFGGVCYAAFQ